MKSLPSSRRVYTVLLTIVLIWGVIDVPRRARVDPENLHRHRTDVTVYTEAGAAFFDGRDPYEVANPRGWHYLYPPLFAILLAPLSAFPPAVQGLLWFLVNFALACAGVVEIKRLGRLLMGPEGFPRGVEAWAILAGGIPILNSLQRGQVGVLVAYFLILGCRLALQARSGRGWFLAGIALAFPVAVKLTPALPAVVLFGVLALRRRWSATGWLGAGGAAGGLLFFLLLPAAFVGWRTNLGHLERWQNQILKDRDFNWELNFNRRSARNQSLGNAVYRAGNWVAHVFGDGPDDTRLDYLGTARDEMPMDARAFDVVIRVVQAALILLLAVVALRVGARADPPTQAAVFGLGCALALIVSPISWGHHFTLLTPAVLFVAVRLHARGRTVAARVMGVSATLPVFAHYLSALQAGRLGILGLGITGWFVAACVLLLKDGA